MVNETLNLAPANPQAPWNREIPIWKYLVKNRDNEKLRNIINDSTLEKLDALSKVIMEEQRAEVDKQLVAAIQEKVEGLKQNKRVDEHMEMLKNKLNLVRILGITAPKKEEPSNIDSWAAAPLRWIHEKTKDVWGVNFVTGFFKDIKGKDIERAFWSVVATPGEILKHIPANILGFIPIGQILNFIPKYGERKVAEIDIQETINRMHLLSGETIVFNGIPSEEWDQWSTFVADLNQKKQKIPTVSGLTENLIKSVRDEQSLKNQPIGTIEVTLSGILKPEDRKKVTDTLQDENKKKVFADQWKPAEIAVSFGDTVSAKKEGDKWNITIPEKQLTERGAPNSTMTRTLKQALDRLTSAKEITVVSDTKKWVFDLNENTMSARIPSGGEVAEAHNNILKSVHNSRIKKIVLGDPDLPTEPFSARFDTEGSFVMCAGPQWTDAINSLSNFDLRATKVGYEFEFNGSWKKTEKMPAKPPA